MAVRDDFTAGEVLAAADLNDTFAAKLPYSYGTAIPTATDDGFLWYDENDTPPTPKFWDGSAFQNVAPAGGLELIDTTSFSAVSSVSINGVFSADYDNYFLSLAITKGNAGYVGLRMRASGSDASGSDYVYAAVETTTAGGPSRVGATGNTLFFLGTKSNVAGGATIHLTQPFLTARTVYDVNGSGGQSVETWHFVGGGYHNQATSYDGFSLIDFTNGGGMSGTISTYGYRD